LRFKCEGEGKRDCKIGRGIGAWEAGIRIANSWNWKVSQSKFGCSLTSVDFSMIFNNSKFDSIPNISMSCGARLTGPVHPLRTRNKKGLEGQKHAESLPLLTSSKKPHIQTSCYDS
jgi:hypothetical protein